MKFDSGLADLLIKAILGLALGAGGYILNAANDRLRELERRAEETRERAFTLELMMRSEMATKRELQDAILRLESAVREKR